MSRADQRTCAEGARAWPRWLLGLALVAIGSAACTPGRAATKASQRQVVVLAASSLTDAFDEAAGAFETENPGTDVVLSFAGSQALAAQIVEGAPADVFASADPAQMGRVADAGLLAGGASPFAANSLAIAVEPGNPKKVRGLEDLARDDLLVVLAAPEVPAGKYATAALQRQGVKVSPVSQEQDVKGVMAKVTLGEADAGIVYATDIAASHGGLEAVAIPPEANVQAAYWVGALRDAANHTGADAFVAFLLSERGQGMLRSFGFSPAPAR